MIDIKKMRDICDSGKWSEDEVRAKRLGKHEDEIRVNGEDY